MSVNQTIVNLNEGNYIISATNISGESESAYIFGFSFSTGFMANTLAIARVEGSEALYADALEDLWATYAQQYGTILQERLALTNVRYDTDILNLFFYTKVKISIRADVIQFD